jgi:ABC-type transport system substrate-binding protein
MQLAKLGLTLFKNLRFDKLLHMLSTQAIVKDITRGLYPETRSVISPVAFGYEPDIKQYPYNPDKAKSLLSEEGFTKGFEIDLYGHREKATAEAIMGYLNKVGLKLI